MNRRAFFSTVAAAFVAVRARDVVHRVYIPYIPPHATNLYARVRISAEMIRASKNDEGAFVRAVREEWAACDRHVQQELRRIAGA
jgi:hypothetical protein